MKLLRLALLTLPLSLLGSCVQRAFFYPDSVLYSTPAGRGLAYDPVTFASRDGTRLAGWFIPAPGLESPRAAKGTVIHFHGNAQNMSAHWQFVAWLPSRGFNLFVFDYRGYGASEGRPDIDGLFQDSNAALDYLRTRADVDPARLLVFGQSLGGTNAIAAIGAGNRAGIRALAVEATFYSYSSIAGETFPGAGWFVGDGYSAARHIDRIAPIPLLLIHGTADAVIPYAHGARLFARARPPKAMITVEGGAHTEAMTERFGRRYQDALVRFFEDALAQAPAS